MTITPTANWANNAGSYDFTRGPCIDAAGNVYVLRAAYDGAQTAYVYDTGGNLLSATYINNWAPDSMTGSDYGSSGAMMCDGTYLYTQERSGGISAPYMYRILCSDVLAGGFVESTPWVTHSQGVVDATYLDGNIYCTLDDHVTIMRISTSGTVDTPWITMPTMQPLIGSGLSDLFMLDESYTIKKITTSGSVSTLGSMTVASGDIVTGISGYQSGALIATWGNTSFDPWYPTVATINVYSEIGLWSTLSASHTGVVSDITLVPNNCIAVDGTTSYVAYYYQTSDLYIGACLERYVETFVPPDPPTPPALQGGGTQLRLVQKKNDLRVIANTYV
jgi:hypothetical protein